VPPERSGEHDQPTPLSSSRHVRTFAERDCDDVPMEDHARRVVAPVFEAVACYWNQEATLSDIQTAAVTAAEALDNANARVRECLLGFDPELATARFALPEPMTPPDSWSCPAKMIANLQVRGGEWSTETRVMLTEERSRRAFGRYWLLIRPFSGLIRRRWLAAVVGHARRA